MRSNWLYFATRSERAGAPVLICPRLKATAMSAMVVSSVSPERCEMTVEYPNSRAVAMQSRVSLSVPIWFGLMSTVLATPRLTPSSSSFLFVTKISSPTSCTRPPRAPVRSFQPSQSSSAMPSSMETIG